MGILSAVWNPEPRADVTWSPLDDRWYTSGLGLQTDAGITLSAESILRCGTVLAAVRFLADAWAMCPANVLRKTARGTEEEPNHYAQIVLRDPNAWQTDYRWQHLNMTWCSTWGNAYDEIVAGREAFVSELQPRHPSLMRVVDQRANGELVYRYNPPEGGERIIGQERVLHFRGLSTDGISGLPIYQLIRNTVGIALAAEKHTATFLRKGARVAGLVTAPQGADKTKRDELRDALREALGGANNTGTYGVIPFGVEVKPSASNNRDSQLLELTDQTVGAILRFLGVPGVVAGYADKTATYASAKEFFESGGIKHCVLPWVKNFEAEVSKALLMRGDGREIKYNLSVLLRASTKDTYDALLKAIGRPFMTGNEGRRIIDLNPIDKGDDPTMDQCVLPKNTGTGDEAGNQDVQPATAPARRQMRPMEPDQDDEQARSRGWQFALDAGARVVRRELAALRDRAPLAARDQEGWKAWLASYYDRHVAHVAEALHVEDGPARRYAENQRDAVLAGGLAVCEKWEETVPYRLAAMAFGEES
jgi:HK97 family phage portal protein